MLHPPAPARAWQIITALVVLAACSDVPPTMPEPGNVPALGRATFRIDIDVASGRITVVNRPGALRGEGAGRPSLSLLGGDAVELHASNCTWTSLGTRKKRCTFDLSLENRLAQTDLITPTSFPTPPAGMTGIFVFPFTSAALGVAGGAATPSPDWDNAPINFFNDFASCATKTADCYRYEAYPGPIYGGESSAPRTVGFDVDRDAHTVSAFIVVAADLRENPVQQVTLAADPDLCGLVEVWPTASDTFPVPRAFLGVGNRDLDVNTGRRVRGFCSFPLGAMRVLQATLRLYQFEAGQGSYFNGDVVLADHLDFGTAIDADDYGRTALQDDIGTLSRDATVEWKTLDVTSSVQDDLTNGRPHFQFRLRYLKEATEASFRVKFMGVEDGFGQAEPNPPELVLVYKNR